MFMIILSIRYIQSKLGLLDLWHGKYADVDLQITQVYGEIRETGGFKNLVHMTSSAPSKERQLLGQLSNCQDNTIGGGRKEAVICRGRFDPKIFY